MSFIIASNWKMNKGPKETEIFFKTFLSSVTPEKIKTFFFVPTINLSKAVESLSGTIHLLGAQNIYHELSGAFTGENSPQVIKEMGVQAVLIGHSERRQLFSETNDLINKKVKIAQSLNLKTILCIGETLSERKNQKTDEVLLEQLQSGLKDTDIHSELHIAYEPVWAIGTGEVATEEQVKVAHALIRDFLTKRYPSKHKEISILYGGSVKPSNASSLGKVPNVGGFLIGGASLEPDSLNQIIQAVGE